LVGPSGSGKTSLLYLLSGLKTASAGTVHLGDFKYSHATANERLDFRRRNFGFVFQQPFLVPYLSVLENVLVPIENPRQEHFQRAMHLLDILDIVDLAPKFPNECSGGERVRVAMARGLVHRPAFLFVDEPTANLDLATGVRVMELLQTQCDHGTLIIVTHDLEILDRADVVFRMRDGALVQTFQPQSLTA
jgi:putative ABC transport system ATP-binding protein